MDCDGCTLCCKMLDVPWLGKKAGVQCAHAVPGVGCALWPEPPDKCRLFACMYRLTPKAGETFRPDRCGVVFEKITPTIVLGTLQIDLQLHRERQSQRLSKGASKQVNAFRRMGLSVVLSAPGIRQKTVYAAPGRSERDVQVEVERLLEAAQ